MYPLWVSAESLKTIILLHCRTRQSTLWFGFELLRKNRSTTEMDSLLFQRTYIKFNRKKLCSLIVISRQPRNWCVAFSLTSISDGIIVSSFSGTKIKCPIYRSQAKKGLKREPHSLEMLSTQYHKNFLKLKMFPFLISVGTTVSKEECVKSRLLFFLPRTRIFCFLF